MNLKSYKEKILLLSSTILVLTIGLVTPQAFAAEGDVLASLDCAGAGVGVGFDGTTLYWQDFIGDILHRCDTAGNALADIPIVGCTATVISWDSTRGMFWGANGPNISLIDTAGNCTPQFTITDTPDNCDNGFGCSSLIDGIAYDQTTDTVWWSPDASQRAYQYNTADGSLVSFFDVNDPPNDMIAECPVTGNYNSGLAAGASDVMWVGANGCSKIFKYTKTGTKITSIDLGLGRTEDMECDSVTFPGVDAIWTKDAFDTELTAFEVADGTCLLGGGQTPVGGSILPIDTAALLIAGAFTNAIWMAPVLAGVAGTTAFYLKTRKN